MINNLKRVSNINQIHLFNRRPKVQPALMKLFKEILNKHWITKVNHNNKKNKLKNKESQKFKKMKNKNGTLKQEIKLNTLVLGFTNG